MTAPKLILIGCVKTKRDAPMVASALYSSPLWNKRRTYARMKSDELGIRWGIVSAHYGVIEPDALISPYEKTIKDWGKWEIRILKRRIEYGLRERLRADMRIGSKLDREIVEVHAGKPYLDLLREVMPQLTFTHPVEGLQIGEQLSFYNAATQS